MDCSSCREAREVVSRHVHEADMDRLERMNKRWFLAWFVTFVLLVACVAGFIWYESQWEVVQETTTMEVEQDADNGGMNKFIGGDYYGTSESEGYEDLEEEDS